VPQALNRHFSALENVHTLKLENVEIHRFMPDAIRYFGHFSLTLRSIALYDPYCNPRQLSHFLSLFPNLDGIEIRLAYAHTYDLAIPNTVLVPYSAPKPRGRLVLSGFSWVETWTHLIASCDLRFRHMDLGGGPCRVHLVSSSASVYLRIRADGEQEMPIYHVSRSSDLSKSRNW